MDTSQYMFAGYTVVFVVMAVYIASLFVRWHNLKRDRELLEEMEKKGQKQ